ncbi:MAG: hypothetical protein WBE22_02890 [Halobacteriota archaeon]
MEKLYRAGPEGTFMRIAANAYNEYGGRFFHNATTTMSLQGEYKHEEGDLDAVPIKITQGFSKDHRPDLKQFVISLVMSDLPVFIPALSGNASDKNHFREGIYAGEENAGKEDKARERAGGEAEEKRRQNSFDGDGNGACAHGLQLSGAQVAGSTGEGKRGNT